MNMVSPLTKKNSQSDWRTALSFGYYLMFLLGGLFLVSLGFRFDSMAALVVGVVMTGACLLGLLLVRRHPRWRWF